MKTKKYTIMEYLSPDEVKEITKTFSLLQRWHKASDFGFKYYYTRLWKFDAHRKKNKFFLANGKKNEVVYLCKAKNKYWISLVYGYNEYLNSPLAIKYSGLWFDNPKKWEKICKDEGE